MTLPDCAGGHEAWLTAQRATETAIRELARQSSAHDVVHSVRCELSGVAVEALCYGGAPPKMSSNMRRFQSQERRAAGQDVRTAQVRNAQQHSAEPQEPD